MKQPISLDQLNSPDGGCEESQSKKEKPSPEACSKCSNSVKPSDPTCDFCSQSFHLICCGLSLKGAKLDAVVDVLKVIGFTCGACKALIKNILQNGSAQGLDNEKKMNQLTKAVNDLKNETRIAAQISKLTDTGNTQQALVTNRQVEFGLK